MSVLINGSPTKYFVVGGGLRKGDPLSPFLFAISAKDLARLGKQEINIVLYKGFNVFECVAYNLIQYVNDIILVGEGSWTNLWAIKSILRGFKMVSSLRINMWKSKIYGIGVKDHFLQTASYFMSCKVDSVHFKFVGIMLGSNHRRYESWKFVISVVRNRSKCSL